MSPYPIPLFALLSIAACVPVSSQGAPPDEGSDDTIGNPPEPQIRVGPGLDDSTCNAEAAQRFIGQTPSDATIRAATKASGATTVRVIGHGMMATMDYRGDRLTLYLDKTGNIVSVNCG